MSRFAHLDSTTHSFHGRKYKGDKVKVNFGHSKGRPDLPQVLQFLMTTESGLPFWTSVRSGNLSDRELFPAAITSVQNYIENIKKDLSLGFIADSALYSKKFLLNKNITSDWITRVPESIKLAKELSEKDHDNVPWKKLNEDYKYFEYKMTYGKVEQRWIVVSSRMARHKELSTVEKKLKKEKADLTKKAVTLMKKSFTKKSEIYLEMKKLQKSNPHHNIHFDILGNFKKGRGQRPRSTKGHRVYIDFERNEEHVKKIQNRKGKFIIATNILSPESLPAEELIDLYLGRNANIERCFRLMKDSSLRLNQIFLKRVDRIQALLTVMTICLFVHNLAQLEVRKSLEKRHQTIPNQVGKDIANPSLKWVFQMMRRIV
ncbi:MAG: IS1634 family transposase, partial [Bdellovibrio sp.]